MAKAVRGPVEQRRFYLVVICVVSLYVQWKSIGICVQHKTAHHDDAGILPDEFPLDCQTLGYRHIIGVNPGPEPMRAYIPDWGTAFVMQDSHWVMHAGQWAVIRRQLGRPPLF